MKKRRDEAFAEAFLFGVFIAMNPLQDLVGISHSYLLHEETEAPRGSSICPR